MKEILFGGQAEMKLLEDRIRQDGTVLPGNVLKVDNFLNHQIDPQLMDQMGAEFARKFANMGITKVLTVESSGIAPAVMAGLHLHVPVIFARKHKSLTLTDNLYTAKVYSYTKQVNNDISIDRRFLDASDRVLIIDDFLANGQAVQGLFDIAETAGIAVAGVGVVIEKRFQKGHQLVEDAGVPLVALASIASFEDGQVVFAQD
jgi:xanthine phosphoribosyltransferase